MGLLKSGLKIAKNIVGGMGGNKPLNSPGLNLQTGPQQANMLSRANSNQQHPNSFGQALAGGLAAGKKPGGALLGAALRPRQ